MASQMARFGFTVRHDHFSLGVGRAINKPQKPSHKSLRHCNLSMLQNQ
jgi:hypothetical protein